MVTANPQADFATPQAGFYLGAASDSARRAKNFVNQAAWNRMSRANPALRGQALKDIESGRMPSLLIKPKAEAPPLPSTPSAAARQRPQSPFVRQTVQAPSAEGGASPEAAPAPAMASAPSPSPHANQPHDDGVCSYGDLRCAYHGGRKPRHGMQVVRVGEDDELEAKLKGLTAEEAAFARLHPDLTPEQVRDIVDDIEERHEHHDGNDHDDGHHHDGHRDGGHAHNYLEPFSDHGHGGIFGGDDHNDFHVDHQGFGGWQEAMHGARKAEAGDRAAAAHKEEIERSVAFKRDEHGDVVPDSPFALKKHTGSTLVDHLSHQSENMAHNRPQHEHSVAFKDRGDHVRHHGDYERSFDRPKTNSAMLQQHWDKQDAAAPVKSVVEKPEGDEKAKGSVSFNTGDKGGINAGAKPSPILAPKGPSGGQP